MSFSILPNPADRTDPDWFYPPVQARINMALEKKIRQDLINLYNRLDRPDHSEPVQQIEKNCYVNAVTALQLFHHALPDHVYVEGYVLLDGRIPIEHGWLQRNVRNADDLTIEGIVVCDPTLIRDGAAFTHGWNVYFPGICYLGEEVLSEDFGHILEPGSRALPNFYKFGFGGLENDGMKWAMEAAYKYQQENIYEKS